jgi:hypothetical protein
VNPIQSDRDVANTISTQYAYTLQHAMGSFVAAPWTAQGQRKKTEDLNPPQVVNFTTQV